jgi:hypothetical protein
MSRPVTPIDPARQAGRSAVTAQNEKGPGARRHRRHAAAARDRAQLLQEIRKRRSDLKLRPLKDQGTISEPRDRSILLKSRSSAARYSANAFRIR